MSERLSASEIRKLIGDGLDASAIENLQDQCYLLAEAVTDAFVAFRKKLGDLDPQELASPKEEDFLRMVGIDVDAIQEELDEQFPEMFEMWERQLDKDD